jgi:S1-C subfamily serine protease
MGSGFFVRSDGALITNHHVIDGALQIAVRVNRLVRCIAVPFLMASDRARDLTIRRVETFDVPVVQLRALEMFPV